MLHDDYYLPFMKYFNGFEMLTFHLGNEAFQVSLVMPPEGRSLDECRPVIQRSILELNRGRLPGSVIDIKIPEAIRVSCSKDYSAILKTMGVRKIFDNTSGGGRIGGIVQESSFEMRGIDGTGKWEGRLVGGPKKALKTYISNRPFIYLVRERSTGLILFIGEYREC